MSNSSVLSLNTQSYLTQFNSILARMAERMGSAEPDPSVSGSFIRQMLPHHEAAIEMSRNLLRYTTDLRLQGIAQDIITEQTRSMEAMRQIRRACRNARNTPQSAGRYAYCVSQIVENMLAAMESTRPVNSIDLNFICEMPPHHEGAIRMSRLALRFSLPRSCPDPQRHHNVPIPRRPPAERGTRKPLLMLKGPRQTARTQALNV